jgi:predicted Zn-ribbon and HTH transcriptional regulator
MSIATIADKLAAALRMMPCLCRKREFAWPFFSKDDKRPDHTCPRCESLALYDAYVSIVQTPGKPQGPTP